MKKLSIEEKVKAYDNVREKIAIRFGYNVAKEIFPEYEESKDEGIRKAIINVFASHKDYEVFFGASVKDILAWLERQGEKKPNPVLDIEIPFGAKDSELYSWEYTIPEGMEATIVDNKIVVKKKENEDETYTTRRWRLSLISTILGFLSVIVLALLVGYALHIGADSVALGTAIGAIAAVAGLFTYSKLRQGKETDRD